MKKITRSDIVSAAEYEKIRDDFRRRMLAEKEPRRIFLGPYLTFLFETTGTMIYQVQEMIRVEKITDEKAIQHEIDTYNQLVPDKGNLCATLLIEIENEQERRFKLRELRGLEKQISLQLADGTAVHAEFDEAQLDPEKISSVQYIRFPVAPVLDAFLKSPSLEIVSEHPACHYRQLLTPASAEALRHDVQN